MTIRWLLAGFCLLVGLSPMRAETPKFNVVLIVADDLGAVDLGCTGSKFYRTPRIDGLAAESLRFAQSYSACPVCSPTRAALMTGKNPARLHLTDWLPGRGDGPNQLLLRPQIQEHLPLEEVTLAERFKTAGYRTGMIGKWHLGGDAFGPTNQGFDVNIAGDHTGTPLSYYAPYQRNGRTMPGLEQAPTGEYLPDRLGQEAAKLIGEWKNSPFFLYLPHYSPHTPLTAPGDRILKFAGKNQLGKQDNPIYAAMVEAVDSAVGKVLDAIQANGLKDRTIVIFTSDNGGLATREGPGTPATINTPFREGKGHLYEGGIRVPLIVHVPGITPKGGVQQSPVRSEDLFATISDLTGIAPKTGPLAVDGITLRPILSDAKATLPERSLYWHYPHYANQGSRPGSAIRKGDWKLIEFAEQGRRELFNVAKDVSESRNLALDDPARVEAMAAELEAWRKSANVQRNTRNPNYRPNVQLKDGSIRLHGRTASVYGAMLRYEPLPHKETLGFWVRQEDYAVLPGTVTKPGRFRVIGTIGCGNGSGGSTVHFVFPNDTLKLTVPETGGFQNFREIPLGEVTLKPGAFQVEVRAIQKPKVAVMDLREIRLEPIGK
ncbi:sulfatase [Tuwongella immobilis]|uniref:Sulfatase N-terminal domain-containing protein n=1 Tax=Tuwongella immobilis TaxID=692036 RepID=A0A6C2YRS6_9BACT|nr:sulfatase [Tuwongella immobilis]VIP04370.1 sulfatase : Sulfatase OS=Planctomyces limnophilus (strain ATCC 43296 / DSM 3776 / IFAM 1008 / 290) GN=Plim_1520 PE=4 SV=1: Sulfatase [Tuwongella immobilis]VTS06102.1 sulfatase : Sulfatase OS=Planctomyces limnophilus (strain ATCC 43296 / DSM 3776 / IFAM 1008 / 290) GN=Plim_1520 PE=4 SV=1: Sulfatase [Tuwongella immobilis]